MGQLIVPVTVTVLEVQGAVQASLTEVIEKLEIPANAGLAAQSIRPRPADAAAKLAQLIKGWLFIFTSHLLD
jgi:hypothetical protein